MLLDLKEYLMLLDNYNQRIEKINIILAKKLALNVNDIQKEKLLIADLGADSLDITEIIMELEDVFDLRISGFEIIPDKITVEDVWKYIDKRYVDEHIPESVYVDEHIPESVYVEQKKEYDINVKMDLTDKQLLSLAIMAHDNNITLNEQCIRILNDNIK